MLQLGFHISLSFNFLDISVISQSWKSLQSWMDFMHLLYLRKPLPFTVLIAGWLIAGRVALFLSSLHPECLFMRDIWIFEWVWCLAQKAWLNDQQQESFATIDLHTYDRLLTFWLFEFRTWNGFICAAYRTDLRPHFFYKLLENI